MIKWEETMVIYKLGQLDSLEDQRKLRRVCYAILIDRNGIFRKWIKKRY